MNEEKFERIIKMISSGWAIIATILSAVSVIFIWAFKGCVYLQALKISDYLVEDKTFQEKKQARVRNLVP